MRKVLTGVLIFGLLGIALSLMFVGIAGSVQSGSAGDGGASLVFGIGVAFVGFLFFLAAVFASKLADPPGKGK